MSLRIAFKNLGPWAVLEYLASPALAFLTTPLIIQHLGLPTFGSWVIILSAVALAVSLSSGISIALGRYLAANALEHPTLIQATQLDALHIATGTSLLGGGLAIAILHFSDLLQSYTATAKPILLLFVGLIVIIDCTDTVFAAILRGSLSYGAAAAAELWAKAFQFLVMIFAIFAIPSLLGLASATCAASIVRLSLRYRSCDLAWINMPKILNHRLSSSSPLLGTVGWATVQNIGALFYTAGDRLIIASVFGPTTLALFAAASQLTNQIQAVLGAAFSVFSTSVARHESQVGRQDIIDKCLRLSFYLAFSCFLVYGLFYLTQGLLFDLWLGRSIASKLKPLVISVILAAATQTLSVPAHFILLGIGKFKLVAIVGVIAGLLTLLCLWFACHWFPPQYALIARSIYGLVLLSYFPVLLALRNR